MNYEQFYARRAGGMKKSAIREFFSLTEQPDVVSFAGGFPSGIISLQFISEMMQDLLRRKARLHCSTGRRKAAGNYGNTWPAKCPGRVQMHGGKYSDYKRLPAGYGPDWQDTY